MKCVGISAHFKVNIFMHSFDLIGVGAPIVDSLAQVEDAYLSNVGGAKGGMELIESAKMSALIADLGKSVVEAPGGSAGNTIQGVARLGLRTTFLGKLGNNAAAGFYRDQLAGMGVDTSRFKSAPLPNARCLSLVTPDSQRTMRTDLGASVTLAPSEISEKDFAGCRHAHLEGYLLFNRELTLQLLRSAKQAGCSISLDLGSFEVVRAARDILEEILRDYVTIVFSNEDEAAAYTDLKSDHTAMATALAKLCPVAVVKLGKDGALVHDGKNITRINPVRVERPVDTTGAGDLWASGFLYGWLQNKALALCGQYGSILGAEVVQIMGATMPEKTWSRIRGCILNS